MWEDKRHRTDKTIVYSGDRLIVPEGRRDVGLSELKFRGRTMSDRTRTMKGLEIKEVEILIPILMVGVS